MLIVGYSAYPRRIDFARMRQIADSVEAVMVTDMAHFAGLVAGDVYPTPIPDSHVVSSTTQKTLRGAWGGLILAADEERWRKPLDSAVFPGTQGGPLMHAIAAKAVCFGEALKPDFKVYARQVVENAKAMAERLLERGFRLTTGGTDNHLMLIDLRPLGLKGRQVVDASDRVGITVNSNSIPYDEASKFNPSGIRLGTPNVTTRGMGPVEMAVIADCMADLLEAVAENRGEAALNAIRERTQELTNRFPLPYALV
jgi:glycine hydroxymethyltransferase